jgi:tetratricopeptide (TPR) repeat protein
MNDHEVLLQRAHLLFEQGRIEDAQKELNNVLQQDPDHAEAFGLYARCYYARTRFDDGIAAVNNAIRLDPEEAYYLYLRAFGFYRSNQNAGALADLDNAIRMNPYSAEFFGLYAFVHLDDKKFNEALAKADEGLQIDPENITCLNARSTALNKLKRVDAAIETMQDALAQDPDNEFTHTTIGWNFLEKGKHKDAATHFREALRIDPNHENARAGLKEALKSKIPPYKWLLRYSFWVSNQGKNARWIIPIAIYIGVRLLAGAASTSDASGIAAMVIIALYLLFIITSWIINPLANFFLLFHKDGKYALSNSEKYTAVSVVVSLLTGLTCFILAMFLAQEGAIRNSLITAAITFGLMAVPLGDLKYPIRFKGYGLANQAAMVLVALGFTTIILAFINNDAASVTGAIFLIGFVLNNWIGVFR